MATPAPAPRAQQQPQQWQNQPWPQQGQAYPSNVQQPPPYQPPTQQQTQRNYPTVSPRVNDPAAARAAAEARIRKMHNAAGQSTAEAKAVDESVRTGVVQFSKVSREEAAERKAKDRAALHEAINSNPAIGIERVNERDRNITREVYRDVGVDIDRVDFGKLYPDLDK